MDQIIAQALGFTYEEFRALVILCGIMFTATFLIVVLWDR